MAEPNGTHLEPHSSDPHAPNTHSSPTAPTSTTSITSNLPQTSLKDDGLSKRPRDARLIHMVLASLGVNAYQERVPLQLLDFAYRYTSSTLQDAVHLTSEGLGSISGSGGGGRGAGNAANAAAGGDVSSVTLAALRLSVASRLNYQFNPSLPKEFYLELAQERNRVALPNVGRDWGVRLPPERYCLTGVGWGVKEEWESEGEEEKEEEGVKGGSAGEGKEDGEGEGKGEGEGEEGEGDANMEDIFGDQGGEEGDRDMADA
ncbi:MAG: Transcription initiation factor TFIID subunit 9 [Pycnora praestabilis]|nr:MAG: Transcription initiation factor TFIID subunit 9 [Pycnora praestabilis]